MKTAIKNRINQIKSGQVPEGYKKTLVGIVPKEWVGTTLSEIFIFKNGLNKEKEAFGTGTPIVNYVDVYKKRGLKASNLLGRVTLSKREISNYNVRKGDVFFTRTSETIDEIGLSSVILDDVNDTVFSGFILRARPYNDRIITEYNQYCYSSSLMRHEIKKKSSCTTRALTNGNLLGQVNINLPSKTEQAKIAEILMKWDEAIEAQEHLIQKLEIRKKALMQKLLTPKEEWKEVKIKDLLISVIKNEKISNRYLEINNIDINTGTYILQDKKPVIGARKAYSNTLLISTVRPYRGAITVLKENIYVSSAFAQLIFDNKYTLQYVSFIVKNSKFLFRMLSLCTGSTYPTVSYKDIINQKIFIPDNFEEQKRIANILSLADKEIELHKQKLEQLNIQRNSLMQLLLTGIVRVN